MHPWWEEELTADDRLALDPGPHDLDGRPDVLVVGGGVVGLAAAVMCRRAGLGRVQVIERERLACGPSGSAAGGLAPSIHAIARPPAFAKLAAESLEIHRVLDREWGGVLGLRSLDWLLVTDERLPAGAVPDVPDVVPLDGDEVREMEPSLAEFGGAISVRGQGWLNPSRLAVELARRAGAVASRVEMTGKRSSGGRVSNVSTTAGDVSPGALILATGSGPAELGVPSTSLKGHLLVTAPAPEVPRAAVASSILVIPLSDGRLLAGGTIDEGDEQPIVRDDVVSTIRAEMARVIPSTAGLAIERAWCCFRPGTPDDLPVLDRLPGLENAWASVGHFRTGLLMAPAAGRAIASWIADGSRPAGIGAFSLARFT